MHCDVSHKLKIFFVTNHNYNNKAKSFSKNIDKYIVMLSPNAAVMFIKVHLEPRVSLELVSFMGQE